MTPVYKIGKAACCQKLLFSPKSLSFRQDAFSKLPMCPTGLISRSWEETSLADFKSSGVATHRPWVTGTSGFVLHESL